MHTTTGRIWIPRCTPLRVDTWRRLWASASGLRGHLAYVYLSYIYKLHIIVYHMNHIMLCYGAM
jgi:hypothetical protein